MTLGFATEKYILSGLSIVHELLSISEENKAYSALVKSFLLNFIKTQLRQATTDH